MNRYLVLLLVSSTFILSCHKDHTNPTTPTSPMAVLPVLATTAVSNIGDSTATSGGSFTTDGTLTISSRGIEWDTSTSFSNHWTVTSGNGIGTFVANLTGLMSGTVYYVRAFAATDTSTYYGNTLAFTTGYTPGKYTVTTVAGTGTPGSVNGDTSIATFNAPNGVAADLAGNIYVSDANNYAIRKIAPNGMVTTLATTDAMPQDLVTDSAGNVYVAEASSKILKITPAGQVSTLAVVNPSPITIAIDPNGNLYTADGTSFSKITPAGVVTTLTKYLPATATYIAIAVDNNFNLYESNGYTVIKVDSSGVESFIAGSGQKGTANGTGAAASFNDITELRTDAAGNIYAADVSNNKIRLITPAGVVTTLAGTGATGHQNGNSAIATFNGPIGLGFDPAGNLLVADLNNNMIRKIIL